MFHDFFWLRFFKLFVWETIQIYNNKFGGGVGWGEIVKAIHPTQIQNFCIFEPCFKSKNL
jgi:hypothetical protein